MADVKFSFAWLTTNDKKTDQIILLDGKPICMNSIWFELRLIS